MFLRFITKLKQPKVSRRVDRPRVLTGVEPLEPRTVCAANFSGPMFDGLGFGNERRMPADSRPVMHGPQFEATLPVRQRQLDNDRPDDLDFARKPLSRNGFNGIENHYAPLAPAFDLLPQRSVFAAPPNPTASSVTSIAPSFNVEFVAAIPVRVTIPVALPSVVISVPTPSASSSSSNVKNSSLTVEASRPAETNVVSRSVPASSSVTIPNPTTQQNRTLFSPPFVAGDELHHRSETTAVVAHDLDRTNSTNSSGHSETDVRSTSRDDANRIVALPALKSQSGESSLSDESEGGAIELETSMKKKFRRTSKGSLASNLTAERSSPSTVSPAMANVITSVDRFFAERASELVAQEVTASLSHSAGITQLLEAVDQVFAADEGGTIELLAGSQFGAAAKNSAIAAGEMANAPGATLRLQSAIGMSQTVELASPAPEASAAGDSLAVVRSATGISQAD